MLTILLLMQGPVFSQTTLISYGATWKYLDNGTDPGSTWTNAGFDDALWLSGASELGYGDGDENTVVGFGGNTNSKYITTYFRRTVSIPSPSAYATFSFNIKRDDGFVLYVNGVEAGRNNMPTGTITTSTLASTVIEDAIINVPVATSFFVPGTNTIAVEIHQGSITSSDISFNLQLQGTDAFTANVSRGPYLQMGNQTSITVSWRTASAMDAKVEVGTTYGTYPLSFTSGSAPADHNVNVTGLSPDTKYYYRIGNTSTMGSPDPENYFTTLPPSNTTRKINIAAFGDCGRNDNSFQSQTLAQYQSFLTANSIEAPDAWLLMGDNAYNAGTDAEYSSNFFTAYGSSILKNHKVYPTPGNHDYANTVARQQDHSIPYYNIFTMPTAAEIGGVASGTKAYYSFNIGNIHFLALDAYGDENGGTTRLYDTTGAQVTWIKADLAANSKKWTICYWHHPPYTKGSHDSDTDPELINIRENFIRILERNGVDLVICGHSHDYERSYLLNGYYKATPAGVALSESDFNPAIHTASQSSAKYDNSANSCPYTYNSGKTQHGTVYVVAGSAGADGGVMSGYPHNALPFSQDDGGMLFFSVDDNRLDAKFIRRDGVIADKFTIMKDVKVTQTISTTVGTPVTLKASWPGVYNWSNAASTRATVITPATTGSVLYTVTDAFGCITDNYTINSSAVLPVTLMRFILTAKQDHVSLQWVTASETQNKQFRVERSSDARNFVQIGTVPALPRSGEEELVYDFNDLHPLNGENYYRLVQEDNDGHLTILSVKKIIFGTKALALKVLSVSDSRLVLEINAGLSATAKCRIFDVQGKEYQKIIINNEGGNTVKQLSLRNGMYVCELTNDKGQKIVKQILIQ